VRDTTAVDDVLDALAQQMAPTPPGQRRQLSETITNGDILGSVGAFANAPAKRQRRPASPAARWRVRGAHAA